MQNNTKPTVRIKDCKLEQHSSGCYQLVGTVIDYPKDHQWFPGAVTNGSQVTTSVVIKCDGDVVETLRTIYLIENWLHKPEDIVL